MTTRERRERRAERLTLWADGREARAEQAAVAAREAVAGIPLGQPILKGHHSQRRHERAIERMDRNVRAAAEHSAKAADMRERAANIEAANERAIYSDDADAPERLRERIAELEAERERIKHYNASCRKAAKRGEVGDTTLLDDAQRAELATIARVARYQLGDGGALPAYKLSNLGGNIARLRKRLEAIERPTGRWMAARYGGECGGCGEPIEPGDAILYVRVRRATYCEACGEALA